MTQDFVIKIVQEALFAAILVSMPILGVGVIVGLVISVIQTTTSIQEQTLVFVPKIIAVILAGVIFGPWMLRVLMEYMYKLLNVIAQI
ncbi:flagellar biosynthesis protein FliQ [bacterium]|nr:flagellar biosynthesis protein FliQ [bacterium]MBU1153924.1 flagellar biosynthesis protein FliQ [bacterium]